MKELDSNDKQLLRNAYSKINAANEIMHFLSDYFRDKYQLTPANQITPDGRIITIGDSQDGAKTIPLPLGKN